MIEICIMAILVFVVMGLYVAAKNVYYPVNRDAIETAIDFTLLGIVLSVFITVDCVRKISQPNSSKASWATRLPNYFGLLSFLSLLGFMAAGCWSQNIPTQFLLAYLPLPGLMFGAFSVAGGIIVYKTGKVKSAFISTTVSIVIIGIFIYLLAAAGGGPFFCTNDNACSVLRDGSYCSKASLTCVAPTRIF